MTKGLHLSCSSLGGSAGRLYWAVDQQYPCQVKATLSACHLSAAWQEQYYKATATTTLQ
jgi:hypothetical protein